MCKITCCCAEYMPWQIYTPRKPRNLSLLDLPEYQQGHEWFVSENHNEPSHVCVSYP